MRGYVKPSHVNLGRPLTEEEKKQVAAWNAKMEHVATQKSRGQAIHLAGIKNKKNKNRRNAQRRMGMRERKLAGETKRLFEEYRQIVSS